jgi:protein disulfide-isomerase
MRRWLFCLSLMVAAGQTVSALEWLEDVPTALARAKREQKAVLLDFTGSDWCGWCIKLKREVFDQVDFAPYANANLIMVEVDFPKHKQLSMAQMTANASLAGKYGIEGYPTIILLNSDGAQIGQTGYLPGGPGAFIANLEKFPGMPHNKSFATQAPAPDPVETRPAPPSPTPALVPLAPTQYGDLALKGISGAGNRRMALINNETLMAGESAWVKTHDKTIEVTVKEIRDASVIIVADGKTRELKYGAR